MPSDHPHESRLLHTTVCVPIVYGCIAFPLKKKVDDYSTHKWTLYVRGPNQEDLSGGISKVTFQLHPSFAQPIREVTTPPYEVIEKGWGEFDATIRIFWRDEKEKSIVLTAPIKLYPSPVPPSTSSSMGSASSSKEQGAGDQPVIHEFYDEVVFTDPTETFYKQLMSCNSDMNHEGGLNSMGARKVQSQDPAVQEVFPIYSDEDDFLSLLEAQKFLTAELNSVKDRILKANQAREEIEQALSDAMALKKGGSASLVTSTTLQSQPVVEAAARMKTSPVMEDMNVTSQSNNSVMHPNSIATSKPPKKKVKKKVLPTGGGTL